MLSQQEPFRLAITMAGAVSAGAYTGGVIDYLFETLESWQQAKDRNNTIQEKHPDDFLDHGYDPSVPMHDIIIDVMSGASAGGMTASIATLGLHEGMKPVNKDNPEGAHNKLYESWVKMVDEPGRDTMSKLLETQDLKKHKEVRSILNSMVIDEIGDQAIDLKEVKDRMPSYISDEFDIILTISNLRGLRFVIDFEGAGLEGAGQAITMHSGFLRYKFYPKNKMVVLERGFENLFHPLDMEKEGDKNQLIAASVATGAFPLGFTARKNSVPVDYIKKYANYLFNVEKGVELVGLDEGEDDYKFTAVDGGMINNEPFGYAHKILSEKIEDIENKENYAILMIDPFPNFGKEDKYDESLDVAYIAKRLIGTLRNQVMFKQDDIFSALSNQNRTRFLISPSRREEGKRVPNPIACGAIGGFSGFFKKEFRHHDFMLGRKNCQSFLRNYFNLKEDVAERVLGQWGTKARERFQKPPKEDNEKVLLPIIPDMSVTSYVKKEYKVPEQELPPFPSISRKEIEQYEKPLAGRVSEILPLLMGSESESEDSFWNKGKKGLSNLLLSPALRILNKKMRKFVINKILEEMESYELLRERKKGKK